MKMYTHLPVEGVSIEGDVLEPPSLESSILLFPENLIFPLLREFPSWFHHKICSMLL